MHCPKRNFALLLLIKIGERSKKLAKITELHTTLCKGGMNIPELFIVDGTEKLSASKARGVFRF
jgi:hypothetical protein